MLRGSLEGKNWGERSVPVYVCGAVREVWRSRSQWPERRVSVRRATNVPVPAGTARGEKERQEHGWDVTVCSP